MRALSLALFASIALVSALCQQPVETAKVAPPLPKLTSDQQNGIAMLEEAERETSALSSPVRAHLLVRLADAFSKLRPKKSAGLLEAAWKIAGTIEDHSRRFSQEAEVMQRLFLVSPDKAERFWVEASPELRSAMADRMLQRRLDAGDHAGALDVIYKTTSDREFPFNAAAKVMSKLPAEMYGERQQLFSAALSSVREHPQGGTVRLEDFGSFLQRFGRELPKEQVLDGIELLLQQARDAKANQSISVSDGEHTATFSNSYEYRVFQMMPLLKELDPSLAEQLARSLPSVQAAHKESPNGFAAQLPSGPEPMNGVRLIKSMAIGTGSPVSNSPRPTLNADQVRQEMLDARVNIERNPGEALAKALTLPAAPEGRSGSSPRVDSLMRIASMTIQSSPGISAVALDEAVKALPALPLQGQVVHLNTMVEIARRLSDEGRTAKAIELGVKVAEKLFVSDNDSDNPNIAIKPLWPSTATWQRFLFLRWKQSPAGVIDGIAEIEDPEVRTAVKIAVARAWLGEDIIRTQWQIQRKNDHSSSMGTM